jgi:hypothetical protein
MAAMGSRDYPGGPSVFLECVENIEIGAFQ